MKIGIIGGFGPETTAEFYISIVNKNRTLGKSHPDILIHSVPVPFDLEKSAVRDGRDIEEFLPLLLNSVKLLQSADIIALPCNTLHIFIEDIRKASRRPVMSILEEISKEIERREIRKIGILATTKTASSGILESKLNNVSVLKPPPASQSRLSEIIHCILQGKSSPGMKMELARMANELESRGAEGVILGCTDLQLLLKQQDVGVTIIDTLDTLANSVVMAAGDKND
ncbi:MAG: amino acid racemase [Candidatus Aenigmarchaeota archaeon]|nr:amino acid racemase [Candidatus Aenigmarchaeota archaeon]